METLILGRPGADRTALIRTLTDEGITVHTCNDGAWGCSGLHDQCPLDTERVTAAVAVAAPGEALDPQGVACAQRARLPIVTIGGVEGDPIHALADAELTRVTPAAAAIVAAAGTSANRHRRAVEAAAHEFLRDGEELVVDVVRDGQSLRATIGGRFAEERISTIADHVRTAIRGFDGAAQVVDVSIDRDAITAPDA